MTERQVSLSIHLKRLGFTQGNQMKLYGEVFEFLSDPIVLTDTVVFMDAAERNTGQPRRVLIPLPIVNMANRLDKAA